MEIFNLISKYRNSLMGIGTILIVFFHSPVPQYMINTPLYILKQRCFIGVDIFLFLSGFGLYYSILKNNMCQFYIRRFKRIYPSFFIISLFFSFLFHDNIKVTIIKLSTLGYWFGLPYFAWYISAIIAFYLFFPFYIKIFKIKPLIATAFFILGGIAITIPVYLHVHDLRIGFFSRIPIFTLGVYVGYLNNMNLFKPKKYILILLSFSSILIGCSIGFLLNIYAHKYIDAWNPLPFIFLVPSIITLLILFFENKIMSKIVVINNILSFLGSLSLEIYLIHETLFRSLDKPKTYLSFISNFLLIFIASTVIAYFISKVLRLYIK